MAIAGAYIMYVRMNESHQQQNKFEIAMFPDHSIFRVVWARDHTSRLTMYMIK